MADATSVLLDARLEPEAQGVSLPPLPVDGASRLTLAHLPALDGLRAVAVAAVVAFHLGRLGGGFLGVDVFFVISGFLITRLLLVEWDATGAISLRRFWARRFRRLVPALLVVLVVTVVASRWWLAPWRITDVRGDALGALAYVANWRFVASSQSYFTQGVVSPLRHTWSLAIEEQFYLVWPLVVVLVLRLARSEARKVVAVVAGATAGVSAVWMAVASWRTDDLSRLYYGTDTRVFAILAGAWLATRRPTSSTARGADGRSTRWARAGVGIVMTIGLVVIAAGFVFGSEDVGSFYRGGFQVVAAASALVVAGLVSGRSTAVTRLLGTPPLRWVGRRSYGIYLWSWPVQVLVTERFRLTGLNLDVTVVAVAVGAAALSFWLVEEPVRLKRAPAGVRPRRMRRVPRRLVVRRVSLAGGSFAAVAVLVVAISAGAPPKPSYLTVSDDAVLDAALAPPSTLPTRSATMASRQTSRSATSPTVTAVPGSIDVLAAEEDSTPTPTGAPTPFDPRAPLLVPPDAQADPAAVRGRPLSIMVAGDSVGWSLADELGPELRADITVDGRALVGCGVMAPTDEFIIGANRPEPYPDRCQDVDQVELIGLSARPDVVFYVAGAWEVYDQRRGDRTFRVATASYREEVERRLQTRVDHYRSVGAGVVLPLVPCFGTGPAYLGTERHQDRRIDWVNARLRAVAARNRGWVRLVDYSAQLCDGPDQARTATPGGLPLRQDGSHYDPPAATWLWNTTLANQIAAAFS